MMRLLMTALALLLLLLGPRLGAAEPLTPALRQQLQQGGLVIYFRHGAADLGKDESPDTVGPCDQQRRLSPPGRQAAHAIGQAFAHLELPVGRVLASPYCRTMETAAIAFGPMVIDPMLRLWHGEKEKAVLPPAVKRLLATAPPPGTNTVLVSHANPDALGIDLDAAEAAVVAPKGGDQFVLLARLKPSDWETGAATVDESAPPWIIAEYPLDATPVALAVSADGVPSVTLVDGAVERLDPFIGSIDRAVPSGRRPKVHKPVRAAKLGKVSWQIAADGAISYREPGARPTPIALPVTTAPVLDVAAADDRLWLLRPSRNALLLIRRP